MGPAPPKKWIGIGFNKVLLVLYKFLIGLFTSKTLPETLPTSANLPQITQTCSKHLTKHPPGLSPKPFPKHPRNVKNKFFFRGVVVGSVESW